MENPEITTYADLQMQIIYLKAKKIIREEEFKKLLTEYFCGLKPASIIKDTLHELVLDKNVRVDLVKVGLNVGTNFIIDKVLGRNRSVRGFLSSMLMEKIASVFINKNSTKIISGIKNTLARNTSQESNQD